MYRGYVLSMLRSHRLHDHSTHVIPFPIGDLLIPSSYIRYPCRDNSVRISHTNPGMRFHIKIISFTGCGDNSVRISHTNP